VDSRENDRDRFFSCGRVYYEQSNRMGSGEFKQDDANEQLEVPYARNTTQLSLDGDQSKEEEAKQVNPEMEMDC